VVVDRLIGLYALFLVGAAAVLFLGYWRLPEMPQVQYVARAWLIITLGSTLGSLLLLGPDVTGGRAIKTLSHIPLAGRLAARLMMAVRLYCRHSWALVLSTALSVLVHTCFTLGVYLISVAMFDRTLTIGQNFFVNPAAAAGSIVPLPAGVQEGLFQFLYGQLLPRTGDSQLLGGHIVGLTVGLVYRLFNILLAAVGMIYYFTSRREVDQLLHETEAGVPEIELESSAIE
jgi:hypothetical protein